MNNAVASGASLDKTKIGRALISLSDKTGLAGLVKELNALGIEIISTGGTAREIASAGLPVIEISDFTGFPEMLDGRVKTLHPKVHGGLLYVRGNANHETTVASHGIKPIDLVIVNLYPFERTIKKPGVTFPEAIENIDIGGPSMLRSAAKNHASVTVVVDPSDYPVILEEIAKHGNTTPETRLYLAAKVYQTTGEYDKLIGDFLTRQSEERANEIPRLLV